MTQEATEGTNTQAAAQGAAPQQGDAQPAGQPARAEGAPQRRPRRGGRYTPRRKVCAFCVDRITDVDYKDVSRIVKYLSERGKIDSRRKTGTCAKHQRSLATAIKRARYMALLPYTATHYRP